jgi:hypothetical protein
MWCLTMVPRISYPGLIIRASSRCANVHLMMAAQVRGRNFSPRATIEICGPTKDTEAGIRELLHRRHGLDAGASPQVVK